MQKDVVVSGNTYTGIDTVILKDINSAYVRFNETSDANAQAEDIKNGKSAYIGGTKVSGTHICPVPVLKEKSISSNGIFEAEADGADGFSKVTVNVPVSSEASFTTKRVTENGTYNAADDGADGYSSVTVNVTSGGVTPEGDKVITENGTFDVTDFARVIVDVPAKSETYFKKVFSGTLTEATKSFKFTTFADGTPLKFTELLIRGAATTNLAAGNIQNLNVYYGWEGDGIYNAYKGIGMIPNFCRPGGTDISSSEYSLRSELLGTKINNQYGYGTTDGVSKTELKTSETDLYTQLAFWSGGGGIFQPGSWFEVYAR